MNPTEQIDTYLTRLPEWQKDYLDTFRKLVHKALPEVEEAWKWSVPVFIVKGKMICAMSAFKEHVKFNFFFGAQLQDEHKLFNNGFESKKHRSIDIKKDDKIDEKKLLDLLTEAGNKA